MMPAPRPRPQTNTVSRPSLRAGVRSSERPRETGSMIGPVTSSSSRLRSTVRTVVGSQPTEKTTWAPGATQASRIVVERSRGVQVGDHNVQVNTYDLSLRKINLDLGKVLRRPDVERALSALAADPTNTMLRKNADQALGARSFFTAQPRTVVERGEHVSSTGAPDTIFGFLFTCDSHGVQVGDRNRQTNTFAYYCSTTVDARALFASSADLRRAAVESVCSTNRDPGVGAALRSAVDDAVARRVDARTFGASVTPRPGASVFVAGRDGVSIGHHRRQVNEARVESAKAPLPRIPVPMPPRPPSPQMEAPRPVPPIPRPPSVTSDRVPSSAPS